MIRIVRPRLPSELQSSLLKLTQELANTPVPDRGDHAQRMWERHTVRRDVYRPVRDALEEMAPGVDCCMYCGNHMADTVDHFVPKSHCTLRTFYWPNLLLACSTCNTRFKGDKHRGDGLVGSLLIDPTREDPFDHLDLRLASGVYRPVDGSRKGKWTIKVCGLNEGRRPRVRANAWLSLEDDLRGWARARADGDRKGMRRKEWRMRNQPFADVYHAALRKAASDDAEVMLTDTDPDILDLLRDEELSAALHA
ncbi:HNH endonuclease [Streptomyces sp. SID8381]|uniref:HNH endonuclease n=1 Tax=unclassified Streptomyces TaxID=2593676 RepID=UPI0006898A80|nr:HNH endonuclease [Streptomyces sp. Amel2xE9]MYX31485.1 HNH endonuclease [Streptomyces sp. SID8381]